MAAGQFTGNRWLWLAALMWAVLMAVAVWTRPLLPVDETRYLAVAWEMWRDGDFLVPHLNGETYSHKPPLLFWLMHLGWGLFGVNDWWPRLVAPLFGLGSLFFTVLLAGSLWPGPLYDGIRRRAPIILIGSLFWTFFTTLTMFDMILSFFALLGLYGLVQARRTGGWRGFWLVGLAIGLGILAKGPAILLHILPVALLAPLWATALSEGSAIVNWRRWYGRTFVAVLIGAAIGLAWAVPAALAGGEAYANAIFWGQSAGRMVDSFAHERPWWWYGAILPPMILPWLIWPPLWQAARTLPRALGDGGVRLLLCWFLPAFIVFTAISGKQAHYLLPEIPAIALLLAFLLSRPGLEPSYRRRDLFWPGLMFAALGLVLIAAPFLPLRADTAAMLGLIEPWWGLGVIAGGLFIMLKPPQGDMTSLGGLAALAVLLALVVHAALRPMLNAHYNMEPAAVNLGQWERQGYTIAHYGKYHGQYNFLGRIEKPFEIIGDGEARAWLPKNPRGKVITYHYKLAEGYEPDFVFPYRRGLIIIWDAQEALKDPVILKRPKETPKIR